METERLVIRPWRREEAPRLLDILSRVEVMKWLGDGPPVLLRTLGEAHARIDRYNHERHDPPLGMWAVERKDDGLVLGTVLLLTLPNDEHGEVEIGWHLHPDSWGHGYATEAARAVLEHGFAAGLPGAAMRTVASVPSSWAPIICVTSRSERSSIGISRTPSSSDQSTVDDGNAT